MRKLYTALSILSALLLTACTNTTIPANNPLIEYTGRIDFSDSLAPKFSFSGVSIRANFSGTNISAILDDDQGENYYNVILDGAVHKIFRVSTGKKTYLLAENLEDTVHEIELFKRTELTFGKTQFFGFIVDEGTELVPMTNQREHFIEYIGNSITCGYGNEGELGGTFGPATENHYETYAAITSRNFNARHLAVCRSGIGIYRNYDGPPEGNKECMPNLYTNIFLYDDEPKYDFAAQPDVICINLGTNDFSTTGADSALYVSNYFRLIDTLQSKYTMPTIVLLAGSMMSGADLESIRGYLEFIADSANNKGMGDVSFFEMSAQTGSLGTGIDYHPTVAQHYKNAGELTAYLQSLMDWKIYPRIEKAETEDEHQVKLEFNTDLLYAASTYEGFTLRSEEIAYAITETKRDTDDESVVHMVLTESLEPETELFLDYANGTVESADSIALAPITGLKVTNSLTLP